MRRNSHLAAIAGFAIDTVIIVSGTLSGFLATSLDVHIAWWVVALIMTGLVYVIVCRGVRISTRVQRHLPKLWHDLAEIGTRYRDPAISVADRAACSPSSRKGRAPASGRTRSPRTRLRAASR